RNAAALLPGLPPGVADPAADILVHKDATLAHVLRVRDQAAAVAVGAVLEHRKAEAGGFFLVHLDAQNSAVEAARAREISHRQVEPHYAIGTRVHFAHLG